ncbi:hypothetical protein [Nocardia alba]|uniref:Xaa-Pro dipeptidase n=1 Tax=Nocardia alba TaxID=225051 RepID=A0A4R1FP42_9NOCA|nr:hypothetical protein [Nocardia alba]TCJ96587.1 hypothetical protein DFR71_2617 [Nocardia alba]
MTSTMLPPAFADLERFAVDWCLPTEAERYARRLASPMQELIDFYDACFPRVEDALSYCDKFSLEELPEDAIHLLHLVYSLVMVAMAVEIFQQPKPVDSADAELARVSAPWP